jgi:hypothetical protein
MSADRHQLSPYASNCSANSRFRWHAGRGQEPKATDFESGRIRPDSGRFHAPQARRTSPSWRSSGGAQRCSWGRPPCWVAATLTELQAERSLQAAERWRSPADLARRASTLRRWRLGLSLSRSACGRRQALPRPRSEPGRALTASLCLRPSQGLRWRWDSRSRSPALAARSDHGCRHPSRCRDSTRSGSDLAVRSAGGSCPHSHDRGSTRSTRSRSPGRCPCCRGVVVVHCEHENATPGELRRSLPTWTQGPLPTRATSPTRNAGKQEPAARYRRRAPVGADTDAGAPWTDGARGRHGGVLPVLDNEPRTYSGNRRRSDGVDAGRPTRAALDREGKHERCSGRQAFPNAHVAALSPLTSRQLCATDSPDDETARP